MRRMQLVLVVWLVLLLCFVCRLQAKHPKRNKNFENREISYIFIVVGNAISETGSPSFHYSRTIKYRFS